MKRMIVAMLVLIGVACSSNNETSTTPAPDAGKKGEIGDPCPNGSTDCATGLICAGEDPGGGQCIKECAPSNDADCGDTTKYACSHEGHCYLRCNTTTDCKRASEGYACKDDTPARPPIKFCDVK